MYARWVQQPLEVNRIGTGTAEGMSAGRTYLDSALGHIASLLIALEILWLARVSLSLLMQLGR